MRLQEHRNWLRALALICAALLAPGDIRVFAQEPAAGADAPKLKSPEALDSLVAPIALYPDPLLAQVMAASTYPLEVVQAARWLKDNSKLKGEELTKAAAKQPWDASVQALVGFPDALNFLDKNIQWTQDLGNAVLDQQSDVMDAVQRMRKKAKDSGKLQTTKEQKVEVQTIEQKQVVVIQPSDPQVIYVPSYNPTVVYGAPPPAYAYPPVTYPYGAVAATAAVSFGVGVMMGAMWGGCCGGGGWGWGASWGGTANININNNFNTRYGYNNIQGGNRTAIGNGNSSWQHNPQHRRSVPYANQKTAQRFGGSSAGGNRGGVGDRGGVGNNRNGVGDRGGAGNRNGVGDRGGVADNRGGAGNRNGAGDRGGAGDRNSANRAGSAGGDRIGNRSIDSSNRSNSALSSSGSRQRSQESSDRGFASSRQSQSGGGGGGGARSSGRSSGGGGRRR